MNVKHLQLIITAQAQTQGAFNDAARQLNAIQNQVAFFNRHSIDLPRTFSQGFLALGSMITHVGGLIGRAGGVIAQVHVKNAAGFADASKKAIEYAGTLQGMANMAGAASRSTAAFYARQAQAAEQFNRQAQRQVQQASTRLATLQRQEAAANASVANASATLQRLLRQPGASQAAVSQAQRSFTVASTRQLNVSQQVQQQQQALQRLSAQAAGAAAHVRGYQQLVANFTQLAIQQQRQAAAALAPTIAGVQQLAMRFAWAADMQLKFAKAWAVGGSIIQGVGRIIGPMIAIAGSALNVFVQVLIDLARVALHAASVLAQQFVDALQKVAVVAGIVGAAIAGLMTIVAKAGLEFNSFREQTLIAFEVMLGSADQAREKFSWLKQFADWTPFDTREVIESGKLLQAYGLDIQRYIHVAGNMASAFNKPLSQAIDLLARAKAGIFDIREYAPLGITRENLRSVGMEFKKGGEPVDRTQLLPAVEQIANRDFGGMMERQSRTVKGLQSTLIAFWTEELPGAITHGLEQSVRSIMLFLLQFVNLIRTNGELKTFTDGVSKLFDIVGAVAFRIAQQIPVAVRWFNHLVETGKWDKFLSIVWGIISRLFNLLVQGVKWVGDNWDAIWRIIGTVTLTMIRLVGGVISGLVNIFVELVRGNINAQKSFNNLAEGVRQFSIQGVNALANFLIFIFLVQMGLGAIEIAIGSLTANVPLIMRGVSDFFMGGLGAAGTGFVRDKVVKHIADFDISQFSRQWDKLGKDPGPLGAFKRGFDAFQPMVDKFLNGIGQGEKPPGVPEFQDPYNYKEPPYTAPPADMEAMREKAVAALEAHLKILEEQVNAWEAIISVAKQYAATLGDSQQAAQIQFNAMLGHLGALHAMRQAQTELVRIEKTGTEEWFKALAGLNKTVEAISKARDAMRDLLFDTQRLTAATDTAEAIFKIAKDVGFGDADLRSLAQNQLNLMIQTMSAERNRLATLQEGTVEWYKQQKVIVDIIGKIVSLRKELDEANKHTGDPKLMVPAAPFGMRGAPFGPEWVRGRDQGGLADVIKKLMQLALNPRGIDLDAAARRAFPGGAPGGAAAGGGAGAPMGTLSTRDTATVFAQENARALAPLLGGRGAGSGVAGGVLPGNVTVPFTAGGAGAPVFPTGPMVPGLPAGWNGFGVTPPGARSVSGARRGFNFGGMVSRQGEAGIPITRTDPARWVARHIPAVNIPEVGEWAPAMHPELGHLPHSRLGRRQWVGTRGVNIPARTEYTWRAARQFRDLLAPGHLRLPQDNAEWTPDNTVTAPLPTGAHDPWHRHRAIWQRNAERAQAARTPYTGPMMQNQAGVSGAPTVNYQAGDMNITANSEDEIRRLAHEALDADLDKVIEKLRNAFGARTRSQK